jgi:ferredoxin-NADP reductase
MTGLSRSDDGAIPVRVAELRWEADDVVSLKFVALNGLLPDWSPGAHLDLVLPVGIVRQYSIVEAATDLSWYRVAVLKDRSSRGGSEYVHMFLRVGQVVAIRSPINHFALIDAEEYRFIAGGIGITPIIAMIDAVQASGREWSLAYAGRRPSAMAFLDRLRRHGDRVSIWPADSGSRMSLDEIFATCSETAIVYCCGPARLLDGVAEAAERQGWPTDQVRFERFKPRKHAHTDDRSFSVRAERSGVDVEVGAHETLLAALERAGVPIAASCRNGVCGTCETLVLSGNPDHRDDVLSGSERDSGETMMVCVSRALSDRLVLEL